MQTLEIRVLNASNQVQLSAGAQFAEADVIRFIAMTKARYPTVSAPTDDNPNATRESTDGEAFFQWAAGIMQGTIANMQSYELELARAVIADPAPVEFTPL